MIVLDNRLLCDLELMLNNGFAPLQGFMTKKDYDSVVENMRLADGTIWPMPIVLPITEDEATALNNGDTVTLADETNLPLATLTVSDVWKPNTTLESEKVYGDCNHPYSQVIQQRLNQGKTYYVGGQVCALNQIPHFDFKDYRFSPSEIKSYINEHWSDSNIVAFQTRNPMHRSHYELTKYAMGKAGTNSKLLLQPIVGVTQECDIDYFTRVKCYIRLMKYYDQGTAKLCLLPLSMRMAGPREALWHALIRKNYGATHFVVGRDHAGPSCKNLKGESFYGPYDAHELLESVKDEVGIEIIKSKFIGYVKELDTYLPVDQVPENMAIENISGTEQRRMLRAGERIPDWFSFPEIVEELRSSVPPLESRGFCLYFVGLSGAGKTTLSKHVENKIRELTNGRDITVLDGDIVRRNLSKGLGFSKADRSTNVRRIGYVASEIVKHRGIVICANIAPYEEDRQFNRHNISKFGEYIEVFVDTDVNTCERRDVKGLYKMAREGKINLSGINDPFEVPTKSEITVTVKSVESQVESVIGYLRESQLI